MFSRRSLRNLIFLSQFKLNSAPRITKCRYASNKKLSATFADKVLNGPSLSDFISTSNESDINLSQTLDPPPYIFSETKIEKKVYVETYGCQMNFNDTEVVLSILKNANFELATDYTEADAIFIMTCAIRDGAERKIWKRLEYFKALKKKRKLHSRDVRVGVLGCMAERLKHQLIEKEQLVDIVAGPDSYKDLPNLLSLANEGQKAVNVMLSYDETYADIMPVRINNESKTAFVSIMRGCDNMCTYCIVPFTRGRERSRPVTSILNEVKYLSDQGIKEITLLGQNVNSYRDLSESSYSTTSTSNLASGFHTVYKTRSGGFRFADLLDKVASINPEIRIRFTSPHPKDFPDEVLHVINDHPNICKQLHLPAQSGSSTVLERMRRGYTREAYLELVNHIRKIIPGVGLTSDFICGFCDETEEDHQSTLSLMEEVKYQFAFIYPYSMREKTKAHRRLVDNVPEECKKRRAIEAHSTFRKCALELHEKEIGKLHLIQVLGPSKRSESEWSGRNDLNRKIIYPQIQIPIEEGSLSTRLPSAGDYVVVEVTGCSSQILKGSPLYLTSLRNFYEKQKNYIVNKN